MTSLVLQQSQVALQQVREVGPWGGAEEERKVIRNTSIVNLSSPAPSRIWYVGVKRLRL